LYGLVAFLVAQRTREIAIRLALGAQPHQVGWLVIDRAIRLAVAGVGTGILLALWLGRVLQGTGLLLGVGAADPVTLLGVGLILSGVVVLASYAPSRRAARTEPAGLLRSE
jgi:putative ABC transport system permease protein